jgi:hypothetical protein
LGSERSCCTNRSYLQAVRPSPGFSALSGEDKSLASVYDVASSGGEENVLFEHSQARPTIELALDRFETVDLPFNDPLAPPILERPGNSTEVAADSLDEADQIRQARLLGTLQPPLQSRAVSLAHHRHKSRQVLLDREQIWTA